MSGMSHIAGAALVVALAGCGKEPPPQAAGGPSGPRAVAVETERVERFAHAAGVNAIGGFEAVDRVAVSPEIAGRIAAIHVDDGSVIAIAADGEPPLLFRLDDELARLRVAEAEARVAVLDAELAQQEAVVARAAKLLQGQAGTAAEHADAELELQRRSAEAAQARAELATAEEELARRSIVAPIAGQAGRRRVSVGSYVRPGDELIEIVSLDPIDLRFTVPADHAGAVARGQMVRAAVDAYPDQDFVGEVVVIEPAAAADTRSLILLARFDNDSGRLRPGMFARVRLVLGEAVERLAVPESAVVTRDERRYVYVVDDGKAVRRAVELGERLPGKVLIASGLSGDETVIVSGLQRVAEGALVAAADGTDAGDE